MPPALSKKTELDIITLLLKEVPPKDVAYRLNLSVDPIYKVRDKYLKQKWVLRRHPKADFDLES